ncbi:hypothetical protein RQP46_004104 [Phenoliferia psychrophenolica]
MAAEISKSDKMHDSFHEHSDDGGHGTGSPKDTAERVVVTEEDSRRICRKTDVHVLSILCWIYFLQILDKSVIGYSAVFGLKTNAHLVGNQYSTIGSIGYYAQLGAQPLAAYLLVKIPMNKFLPFIVLCWGASLCGMGGSTNYQSLLATRFLLGFFEAACLPTFSLITSSYYRRQEQPMRVAAWYGTNGMATMLGSLMVFGLGHIHSPVLFSYQIIFLVFGLITVITAPILYYFMDPSIAEARFLNDEDRLKAVERLRTNNTGIASSEFKWSQVYELLYDPKTIPFIGMTLCVNVGASVSNVFGPLILQGIAGFTASQTTLLNIPFGALQLIVILAASFIASRYKIKSAVFAAFMVPVVIGAALLYALPHTKANKGPLLLGYYLLSFLFAANPIIVSWISGNIAGQTKKAAFFCLYNASSSAGNIIGPNLFKSKDAPTYKSGLQGVLGIFCALIGIIGIQTVIIALSNKRKEAARVKVGKPAKLHDLSMDTKYDNSAEVDGRLGANGLLDMTDLKNDEFVYVL